MLRRLTRHRHRNYIYPAGHVATSSPPQTLAAGNRGRPAHRLIMARTPPKKNLAQILDRPPNYALMLEL